MSTAATQHIDVALPAPHAAEGAPLELGGGNADAAAAHTQPRRRTYPKPTPGPVQVIFSRSPLSITPETVLQLLQEPALPLPGHGDHRQLVRRITESLVVKRGLFKHPVEATMMEFVRTHTSIPVPTVHLVFTRIADVADTNTLCTYIVMDCIPGSCLQQLWGTLDEPTKTSVLTQIQGYIHELRSIPPETDTPGPIGEDICRGRWFSEQGAGPFPTHEALVEWWNRFFPLPGERGYKGVEDRFHVDHPLVLNHGDLTPRNVIVHEGVVWLVDWELAGWYPWYVDPIHIATDWGTPEFPTPRDWAPSVLPFFPDSERELQLFKSIFYKLKSYYVFERFAVRDYDTTTTPTASEKV